MSDFYKLTTPATTLPISKEEALNYLRAHEDDALSVDLLLRAALQHAERHTGRDFRANTWTLVRDGFPANSRICLQRSPVASVTSVKRLVWDDVSADVLTAVPTADYWLKKGPEWSEVLLLGSGPTGSTATGSWPTDVSEHQPESNVEVEFKTEIPDFIEQAKVGIMHLLAALWANRGDALSALSAAGKVALAANLGKQSGANALLDFCKIENV